MMLLHKECDVVAMKYAICVVPSILLQVCRCQHVIIKPIINLNMEPSNTIFTEFSISLFMKWSEPQAEEGLHPDICYEIPILFLC